MQSSELTFGYWALRGRGEYVKLLMEYTGLKYNEKRYETQEEWRAAKTTLGLDFPNLPYIIDGDKKFSESEALMKYVCIKSGHKELLGVTEEDQVNLALTKGVLDDLRSAFVGSCFNKDFYSIIDGVIKEKVLPKLESLNKFVGDGVGLIKTGLTWIDFIFYCFAQFLSTYDGTILDNYPNLKRLVAKIGNLPQIQSFIASDRYISKPWLISFAIYNGNPK